MLALLTNETATMNHLEVAKKIAEQIDLHSQAEVEAMIKIVALTRDGIDYNTLYRAVGQCYAKLNPAVLGQVETVKTFKSADFTEEHDSTNVVFCQATKAPNENWIECDASEIKKLNTTQLYLQAGVRYYGYL